MNKRQIRVSRQQKSKGQKMLRAITQKEGKKKKLRAVASSPAAGFNEEDKSLSSKIIMGLFIILLLHILAVAAIVVHGKFNKENIEKVKVSLTQKPVVEKGALAKIADEGNRISSNESFTWVHPGDTYESIAQRVGCEEEELKILNKNKPIRAGNAIKTPPRKIEVKSPEVEAVGTTPQVIIEEVQPKVHRAVVTAPESQNAQNAPVEENTINHTFKSGESFWALSKKYNTSVPAIQKANPHLKPTSIKEGTVIKIPR